MKIYLVVCLFLMLIPSVGMIVWNSEDSAEKRELAELPSIQTEDGLNLNYLSDLGEYFDDHFAFRSVLVSADSWIQSTVFHTSASDQVILGKDGWLFYEGEMNDYQGLSQLSDRELNNIVHNLKLYQWYINSCGSRMILAIAPNKSSIYPEQMPDRYLKSDTGNLERLQNLFDENGIEYVDLYSLLLEEKKQNTVYYREDSHWNYTGALAAYNSLMEALGLEHETFAQAEAETGLAYEESDLGIMLYPAGSRWEKDLDYSGSLNYSFTSEETDLMADLLQTAGENGNGTLLMYRDSFGQALIPFLSDQYASATYSRIVPYNLFQIESLQPSDVIIERVERRISSFQEQAAVMRMPLTENRNAVPADTETEILMEEDGDFYRISGSIKGCELNSDSQIFLQITCSGQDVKTYPVFYTEGDSDGNGFDVFLQKTLFPEGETKMEILVQNGSSCCSVAEKEFRKGKSE